MKYHDRYPNMKPLEDECDNIMRGVIAGPCTWCGKPTHYIEINYEAWFCSEECLKAAEDDWLAPKR